MKRKILALLLNLILMAVAGVLIVFFVFRGIDRFTRHGESITVPDVIGMSVSEAEAIFKNQGLQCVVADSTYVKDEIPGRILDYSPSRNKLVKEGRIIYLTINTQNIPEIPVPDVADNSSVRQARASMLSVGFKLTEDEFISGQKDWVYEVKHKGRVIPAGGKAPNGATLTLVVGDGNTGLEVDSLSIDDAYEGLTDSVKKSKPKKPVVDETWFN